MARAAAAAGGGRRPRPRRPGAAVLLDATISSRTSARSASLSSRELDPGGQRHLVRRGAGRRGRRGGRRSPPWRSPRAPTPPSEARVRSRVARVMATASRDERAIVAGGLAGDDRAPPPRRSGSRAPTCSKRSRSASERCPVAMYSTGFCVATTWKPVGGPHLTDARHDQQALVERRQQHVLHGLGHAVELVDEEDGALAHGAHQRPGEEASPRSSRACSTSGGSNQPVSLLSE